MTPPFSGGGQKETPRGWIGRAVFCVCCRGAGSMVFNFFREAFRWHTVFDTGVWRYQENAATGRRRVLKRGAGHQPINRHWLDHIDVAAPALPKGNQSAVRPARRVEAVAVPRQEPLWRI